MNTPIWIILLVLFGNFIGAIAGLMIKQGSKYFRFSFKIIRNKHIVIGIILYFIAAAVAPFALHYGDLTVVFPLTATAYIWTAIFSKVILKENMNIYKILGIALIIFGAILIVR